MKTILAVASLILCFIGQTSYSSSSDYSQLINEYNPPTMPKKNSSEAQLYDAFHNMRNSKDFISFDKNVFELQLHINTTVNKDELEDQTLFIDVAQGIREQLYGVKQRTLQMIFDPIIFLLDNRINLAAIDQEIYLKRAYRDDITKFPFEDLIQQALNRVIGKVFHIVATKNDKCIQKEAISVGSGMLINFEKKENRVNLLKIEEDTQFNGIMTCAHNLRCGDNQRIKIYFVPNEKLQQDTGLPQSDTVNNFIDLVSYLESEAYEFLSYITRDRQEEIEIYTLNNSYTTIPQYQSNEDIAFCKIVNSGSPYKFKTIIDFTAINQGSLHDIIQDQDEYYAIGYPRYHYYNRECYKAQPNKKLIEQHKLTPLTMTKALTNISEDKKFPYCEKGLMQHEARTAKGMSGGPVFTVKDGSIHILACISAGDNDVSEACY